MSSLVISKGVIPYTEVPNVLTENKPVIFWDTCPLLYFNSIIERRAYREYEWDMKLLQLIENGSVYSVTSSIVNQEFDKHHDSLRFHDEEKEKALGIAMGQYGSIVGRQDEMDLQKGIGALHLSAHMESMVTRLWRNTYVIDEDILFHKKAHNRVLGETPPCSEKQQYKDCYIWETFLSVCDNLANKGMAYFMTENTEDYCGKKSKTLLPDIQNELASHQGYLTITKCQLWVDIAKKLGLIPA